MRKLSRALAGTALAAGLMAGAMAAPATAAATTSAATVSAAPSKHFFGAYYSHWSNGFEKSHKSYFKGYWTNSGGQYWFYGDVFDRDRDRQWTYVWYRYTDKFGRSHEKFFKNNSFSHGNRFNKFFGFKKGFVKDVDFRVCEGVNKFDDCGGWGDAF
ncbi:hypothetical protein [Herbidospora mongoliensis]|uniref:hypothetical protein n=1 Tax=Herbidospora mongoliensis TaxID=688067 RepID=UPI00082BC2D4|nr:hypothetical protein [Herbidospora mongoliensis]